MMSSSFRSPKTSKHHHISHSARRSLNTTQEKHEQKKTSRLTKRIVPRSQSRSLQPWFRPPRWRGGGGSPRPDRRATLPAIGTTGGGKGSEQDPLSGALLGGSVGSWVLLGREVHLRVPGPTGPEMVRSQGANYQTVGRGVWTVEGFGCPCGLGTYRWTEKATTSPGGNSLSQDKL